MSKEPSLSMCRCPRFEDAIAQVVMTSLTLAWNC